MRPNPYNNRPQYDLREDKRHEQYALENGFGMEPMRGSMNSFVLGDTHIWACRDGWQIADLLNGSYTNHRGFYPLKEALKRVLKEQTQ